MLNSQTITKLSIITAIVATVLGFFLFKSQTSVIPGKNKLLLVPLLQGQQITRVLIKDAENSIDLKLVDNKWGLQEKNHYPVLQDRVKELLASLNKLKIIEPKTNNPELYEQLGLGDDAIVVILKNADDKEVLRIFIGNADHDTLLVRLANDPQTWLVRSDLFVDTEFKDWVDEPLLGIIDPVQIKQLTLSKDGQQFFAVKKISPDQEDFEKLLANSSDIDTINSVPFKIADLEFEDVTPVEEAKIDWSKPIAAQIETFNGVKLDLELVKTENDTIYARVYANSLDNSNQELIEKLASYTKDKASWYYKVSPELYNYLQSQ